MPVHVPKCLRIVCNVVFLHVEERQSSVGDCVVEHGFGPPIVEVYPAAIKDSLVGLGGVAPRPPGERLDKVVQEVSV